MAAKDSVMPTSQAASSDLERAETMPGSRYKSANSSVGKSSGSAMAMRPVAIRPTADASAPAAAGTRSAVAAAERAVVSKRAIKSCCVPTAELMVVFNPGRVQAATNSHIGQAEIVYSSYFVAPEICHPSFKTGVPVLSDFAVGLLTDIIALSSLISY